MTGERAHWWMGLRGDHLYEQCPGRRKSVPRMQNLGWSTDMKSTLIDPDGGDLCLWCVRVWKARHRQAVSA